jgi:hypothetical protein
MRGTYVKIASWHVILTPTRVPETYRTLCGRTVTTRETKDELPLDEKSCEICLRLAAGKVYLATDS